ncbi:hypothetical protein EVAR_34786_1 [Eumeta japonica]|uniref:Uncharacterized protein n=1 Tax=Eumeta variegata TaxID=151549 RepID=A0A4C1WB67_EUMVA|nr:hypothetical protein EVAR_34786_1 [Eumeta japonica]
MQRFVGDDSNAMYDMVTDDESWIYFTIPKPKDSVLEILAGLPYGSDLAPCNFYLFSKKLRGKRFTNPEEAVAAHEKTVGATLKRAII